MSAASRFLYFAYGSNMLSARLLARTPTARVVGVARLLHHSLRWHKLGADGSGKCDVVPAAVGDTGVHGVLFDIALAEKPLLDAAEDRGVSYADKLLSVECNGQDVMAWTYLALKTDAETKPFDWYKALVVAGAQEHKLPPAYVQQLVAVPAQMDTDTRRAARHFALISGSARGNT